MAPTRAERTDLRPNKVTACVLTCIPARKGYYAYRLDVLKACLASLLAHTPLDLYDLLVFDNGSCPEVVDYLRSLHASGRIHYLMLSARNIGKVNACKAMFRAAPADIISYADDDVLFYPGWLEASLEVLETYPTVGMVSAGPVRSQFRYGNRYLPGYLAIHPDVSVERGRFIPDEWEHDFARSIGRGDAFLQETRQLDDILLEYRGIRAYSTATHFQYLAHRDVMLQGIAPAWDDRLMEGPHVEIDKKIDDLGFARLSTHERYVRHLGNVLTDEQHRDIVALGVAELRAPWTPPSSLARRFVRLAYDVKERLSTWAFFARNYR